MLNGTHLVALEVNCSGAVAVASLAADATRQLPISGLAPVAPDSGHVRQARTLTGYTVALSAAVAVRTEHVTHTT